MSATRGAASFVLVPTKNGAVAGGARISTSCSEMRATIELRNLTAAAVITHLERSSNYDGTVTVSFLVPSCACEYLGTTCFYIHGWKTSCCRQ